MTLVQPLARKHNHKPRGHRNRFAAGRVVIKKVTHVRTLRDMIRKHVADAGLLLADLHVPWKCKPNTVRCLMCNAADRNKRPLSSQYIDALVDYLKLDEFDATELYRQGAREAGYAIDGPTLENSK